MEQRQRDREQGRGIMALVAIVVGIVVVTGVVVGIGVYQQRENMRRAKEAVQADDQKAWRQSVNKALQPKPSGK